MLKFRLAAFLSTWLAAVLIVAWLVLDRRAVALERGERATAAFARVVEQQVARTFQAINLTLGAVGDAHHLSPRPQPHDPDFQRMMQRRVSEIPFVRALFIIGPDGWIIHDTDYPATPPVSLADRAYFSAHAEDPEHGGAAWPPLPSRSGSGWFLPVTRPLSPSGTFEGVLVAAIQAGYFQAQFKAIGLADGYCIALLHLDGTLVASHPARPDGVGKSFAQLPVFRHLRLASNGSFWSSEAIAPGERVISYRTIESAPFVLHVSRAKAELLGEWYRTAAGAAVAMLVLTTFLGWFITRSARDSMRRARERERRAQAEKLEALGQLTAGFTHDFGNMLSVVAMNVELLRQRGSDAAIAERALATTERTVRDSMEMLERLLSFARRRPLAVVPMRLDAWLHEARPLLAQAAGPRVTLSIEASSPLPEALCDSAGLDTALVNVVVNARDAMAGSGRIDVRAYACDNDSGAPKPFAGEPPPFVCIAVRDAGPGMSEEVRRRAIEPFFTTKGDSGTGLGLSQVYGFMQQVGGDITIASAPGRGTTVHLFFPVAHAPHPPDRR